MVLNAHTGPMTEAQRKELKSLSDAADIPTNPGNCWPVRAPRRWSTSSGEKPQSSARDANSEPANGSRAEDMNAVIRRQRHS